MNAIPILVIAVVQGWLLYGMRASFRDGSQNTPPPEGSQRPLRCVLQFAVDFQRQVSALLCVEDR